MLWPSFRVGSTKLEVARKLAGFPATVFFFVFSFSFFLSFFFLFFLSRVVTVIKAKEHKAFKLSKTLYDLRQAPMMWNIRLDKNLKSLKFMKCSQEQTVYTRNNGTETLIVDVYVVMVLL